MRSVLSSFALCFLVFSCEGQIVGGSTGTPLTPPGGTGTTTLGPVGVDALDCSAAPSAEHLPIHRLTSVEYDNSVRDLLHVTGGAAAAFPPQPVGPSGYTNDSSGLNVDSDFVATLYSTAQGVAASVLASKGTTGGAYATLAPCATGFAANKLTDANQTSCMQTVISTLGTLTYRRPVTTDETTQLTATFTQSGDFDTGLGDTLLTLLMSPSFVFVSVVDPQSTNAAAQFNLNAYALASRLSYFLWHSMPDSELFARAADGTLSQPDVLTTQVKRMLVDPKSASLLLTMRNEYAALAKLDAAPVQGLDETVRTAMIAETDAFLNDLLANDRNVLDVVNAKRSFANKVLADYYGFTFPAGTDPSTFVAFEGTNTDRVGLGTQGSILTSTAGDVTFTHPVKRGHFVVEKIMCQAPNAPPPNIPAINPDPNVGGTPREKLLVHESNPACVGCHHVMDAVGLGLENYDPFGHWRSTYPGSTTPIDASGTLPDGQMFQDPRQMYQDISTTDDASACIAQQLMNIALQMAMDSTNDRCTQLKLAKAVTSQQGSVSSMVGALVSAPQFLMQAGEAP